MSGSEDSTEPMDNSQITFFALDYNAENTLRENWFGYPHILLNLWIPDFMQNFSRKFTLFGELFSAFKEILKIFYSRFEPA